ncbi:MAG: tetratricopeptide repeat protein [Verrucomicrobiota bacterium]
MNPWPLIPILLLAGSPALLGQDAAALMKSGESALADGLWEVASPRFRQVFARPNLAPELKAKAGVRLAEALIREGNPTEALEILEQSTVTADPEAPFWKAQARAAQHHFGEAIELFSTILANPASPHRNEAGFTRASLQLSLGLPEDALATLALLLAESTPEMRTKILLYQAEILLDLGRLEDARRAMPDIAQVAPADAPLAAFLEAGLQLREGRPDVAETGFRVLLTQTPAASSEGLSRRQLHLAAIGLADAIAAQGDPEVASRSLLDFIQDHPDSPLLDAMFSRLLRWLPAQPTATDAVLERVAEWIPPAVLRPISGIPGAAGGDAVSAWPAYPEPRDNAELIALALYLRAVGLHRIPTPEAAEQSRRLINRLRIEFPDSKLASRAAYQLARWNLENGHSELAFAALETLREVAQSPALKGQAAFVEARAAYQNGDLEKAILRFEDAASFLTGPDARAAKLQESITRIRAGQAPSSSLIAAEGKPADPELAADLELEQALSTAPPAAARTALDQFLTRHPSHPRAAEARLAAAEAALATPQPDLGFATAQLDALASQPADAAQISPARVALARLRILDLSQDTAATIAAAQAVIDTYPGQEEAEEAAFTLGSALFRAGNYNPARLALEKLAASTTENPDRAQAAWLLAARAAALGGTEASKKEAIILFDKAIETGGPVTAIASLEKARHLIDLTQSVEAADFLKKWISRLPPTDTLRLPAGLLLGEALFSQGTANPTSLADALAVYDKLLERDDTPPALSHRLQYLRGKTLEQMPDAKDATKTREKEAFQAYHSVLDTTTTPAEWEYFERCGFRALELLEKAERWQAAIAVARKIASFGGPRAAEAAERANEIHLRQQVWED